MSKQGESITATEPAATTAPPVSEDAPMTDAPANTDPAPPKPNVSEEEAAVLREERRVLMEKGSALHSKWKELSCAFHLPCVEPSLPMAHWDYVLREGKWMAEDFMQERLWKQAAAVKMCLEALKAGGRTRLKPSKHGPTKVSLNRIISYVNVDGDGDEPLSPLPPSPQNNR